VNAQVLRLTGFTGILSVAALRALVAVQPQVLFDVDPARDNLRQQLGLDSAELAVHRQQRGIREAVPHAQRVPQGSGCRLVEGRRCRDAL
jgi:hypothetical protein